MYKYGDKTVSGRPRPLSLLGEFFLNSESLRPEECFLNSTSILAKEQFGSGKGLSEVKKSLVR
jgi:hypothetical protein